MFTTINDYLNNLVKKTLGESFKDFLENGNCKVKSQILTNENYVCFNSNDIKLTLDNNEKPIKIMMGIRLPDFESCDAKDYYGKEATSNYERIVDIVYNEIFKNKKFDTKLEPNYIKINHKHPSLSVTIFPLFIKEAHQNFYISKGDGEWKQLIEDLEVYKIPSEVNRNILKVSSLIHAYINKNGLKINDSYITYIAFTNLLDKPDLDLKDSLALVLRKLKAGLKKDKTIYNKVFNLQQTLDRAIQIEKKAPEEAIKFIDSFLNQ